MFWCQYTVFREFTVVLAKVISYWNDNIQYSSVLILLILLRINIKIYNIIKTFSLQYFIFIIFLCNHYIITYPSTFTNIYP
jgi:hypothetical protein